MSRAASLKAELTHVLKDLRLPTVRACYAEPADQARQEELAYEGYRLEVVRRESETRRHHRISRYLRQSKLPLEKKSADPGAGALAQQAQCPADRPARRDVFGSQRKRVGLWQSRLR